MTTPLPPDTRRTGDRGHVDDHNRIVDALKAAATVVVHGTNAATPRPVDPIIVYWVGPVAPLHAVALDEWTDTAARARRIYDGTSWHDTGGGDATGAVASAIAVHVAAADPHGDRSYTDTRIAALVGAAPALLDTLAELAAQLQSDESAAAALTTAVSTKAATSYVDAHDTATLTAATGRAAAFSIILGG